MPGNGPILTLCARVLAHSMPGNGPGSTVCPDVLIVTPGTWPAMCPVSLCGFVNEMIRSETAIHETAVRETAIRETAIRETAIR